MAVKTAKAKNVRGRTEKTWLLGARGEAEVPMGWPSKKKKKRGRKREGQGFRRTGEGESTELKIWWKKDWGTQGGGKSQREPTAAAWERPPPMVIHIQVVTVSGRQWLRGLGGEEGNCAGWKKEEEGMRKAIKPKRNN